MKNNGHQMKTGAKTKVEFVQLRDAIIGTVNELFQQRQCA